MVGNAFLIPRKIHVGNLLHKRGYNKSLKKAVDKDSFSFFLSLWLMRSRRVVARAFH
jgi:hypothetical protein